MTLIWLVVWLLQGHPALHQWNNWLISLCACIVMDMIGGGAAT